MKEFKPKIEQPKYINPKTEAYLIISILAIGIPAFFLGFIITYF